MSDDRGGIEHVFRVAQSKDNHVPTVTSDHYIPVIIQSAALDFRGPVPLVVYVRVSGLADGELELTLDRSSGELRRLIILDRGSIAIESPRILTCPSTKDMA